MSGWLNKRGIFATDASMIRCNTDLAQELQRILVCLVLECCETQEDHVNDPDTTLHNYDLIKRQKAQLVMDYAHCM